MIKKLENLIGNTPIVRLESLETPGTAQIYAKLEQFNLGGSIKDRIALGMLRGAVETGRLVPGMGLVEPTSGNTGIAIALLGHLMGHPVTIVMPESMSKERRQLIAAYGAELLLTPAAEGMGGAIRVAQELAMDTGALMLQQFANPDNPLSHYQGTVREILRDLPETTHFIAGIGTGGTVSGVGRGLKEFRGGIRIIGLEPAESAVLSGNGPGSHPIQGIGAGFIPDTLDQTILDEVRTLAGSEVLAAGPDLYQSTGLFAGISGMANLMAARELAAELDSTAKVLTVIPDDGMKYLSTGIYERSSR